MQTLTSSILGFNQERLCGHEISEGSSGYGVIGPDDTFDVLFRVDNDACLSWWVAPDDAVGIFYGAAPPGWITEEADQAKIALQLVVVSELRAIVGGDRTPGGFVLISK